MPSDLASLFIRVDSKGVVTASKDLNKLTSDSKKTETATEGVTRGFSKLQAVVIALASSYALLKMAQYIKDAALLAARYETLGVVMRVVGNNAGYTGAQMDKFARGLQKAGIAMVESRNTLARMIQAQIDLTSSQKLARIAQDAAVIGNINSSVAFERMIYGLQTGMPRILRTIGLNVDFNASIKALAVSLGIKRKAMSEVQVMQGRVNAVIKAGILIEGTYEAAMETAGKKLTSFTRYVEDFKVKMGEAFGPATVILVDAATEAMKDMQEQISRPEAQEALRELSSQLAEIVVQLGQDLPKAIENTTYAISKLTALYNSLPEGVVGAAGVGLIGRILLGSTPAGAFAAGLYLISKQVDKLNLSFQKDWQAGMLEAADAFETLLIQEGKFKVEFDEQGINQFEKMQEMLSKGIPIRLDFALEDPSKYFGDRTPAAFAPAAVTQEEYDAWNERNQMLDNSRERQLAYFENSLALRKEFSGQDLGAIIAAEQAKLDIQAEFDDQYFEIGKSKVELEQEQIAQQIAMWEEAGVKKSEILEVEWQMHKDLAERQVELWWNNTEKYRGFAQQMTTFGIQYLRVEGEEKETIGRKILATSIRFLAQELQQYMFMKAKEHLIAVLTAASYLKVRSTQMVAEMAMGATMAAAWTAYLTALSLVPVTGPAYVPAAVAMGAATAGFGIAGAGVTGIGATSIAAELGMAAAWMAGGILAGAVGEVAAAEIEAGGDEGQKTIGGGTGGGYTLSSPDEAQWKAVDEPVHVSRTVNVHIYGNVVDHDEFARELVPSIQKAIDDGVH